MRNLKIDKVDDSYIVRKPLKYDDGFEKYGKQYSKRGLFDLLRIDRGIEFIISDEVRLDIKSYEKEWQEKQDKYSHPEIIKYKEFEHK